MPRKKTTETTTKATPKPVAKAGSKPVAKVSARKKETPAQNSYFSTLLKKRDEIAEKVANYPAKYKVSLLAIIIGLSLLGFFGYRFLVFAWVDQTPVTRVQLYQKLEERYGKDMKEQLISEVLIENEARKRGASVTQADIDAQIKKIEDQQGGKDRLDQILQLQGIARTDLAKQLKYQVMIDKMFGQNANVSDSDVKDYIEKNKEQYPDYKEDESSESAKTKADVSELIKKQKLSQNFNDWFKQELQSPRVKRL